MATVKVETIDNSWGITHIVTGKKDAVRNWCKRMEKNSPGRVLVRPEGSAPRGEVTWRVDVDTFTPQAAQQEEGYSGPGILGCIAIGLGIGWLFGG